MKWFATYLAMAALGFAGDATAAELGQAEMDVLRAKLANCWALPARSEKLGAVLIKFRLTKSGELDGKPEVVSARPEAKLLEASAVRAILRCTPFANLAKHPESFEVWREITVSFDSADMF